MRVYGLKGCLNIHSFSESLVGKTTAVRSVANVCFGKSSGRKEYVTKI